MTPQELQRSPTNWRHRDLRDRRAGENLQEFRWVLQDSARMKLPLPAKKTIDLEGKLIKDVFGRRSGTAKMRSTNSNAINQYRKLSESKPLTLQGSDYAHAILELNKAIDHAEGLLLQ
jgi:hypothetical protein